MPQIFCLHNFIGTEKQPLIQTARLFWVSENKLAPYKYTFLLLEVSVQFHVPVPLLLMTILSEAGWFSEYAYSCLCAVKFLPFAKFILVSDTTFCTISKVKWPKVNRNVSTFLFTLSFSWELYLDDSRKNLPVFIDVVVGLMVTPPTYNCGID
jgi:hypothetical protein